LGDCGAKKTIYIAASRFYSGADGRNRTVDLLIAQAVFAFAMSFNGYEHFGPSSASMQAAKQKNRATLIDVRNELFASARALQTFP
jgi:hypothetical protein